MKAPLSTNTSAARSLKTDAKDASVYIREGYAFSPMYTLGMNKKITEGEVVTTWLNLAKAN